MIAVIAVPDLSTAVFACNNNNNNNNNNNTFVECHSAVASEALVLPGTDCYSFTYPGGMEG